MNLSYYLYKFAHLRCAKYNEHTAPHKAVMLIAVMRLIKLGEIRNNKIYLTDNLINTYKTVWVEYIPYNNPFSCNFVRPFWALQTDGFWWLVKKDEQENTLLELLGISAEKISDKPKEGLNLSSIKDNYTCAKIDKELFDCMSDPYDSEELVAVLKRTYLNFNENKYDEFNKPIVELWKELTSMFGMEQKSKRRVETFLKNSSKLYLSKERFFRLVDDCFIASVNSEVIMQEDDYKFYDDKVFLHDVEESVKGKLLYSHDDNYYCDYAFSENYCEAEDIEISELIYFDDNKDLEWVTIPRFNRVNLLDLGETKTETHEKKSVPTKIREAAPSTKCNKIESENKPTTSSNVAAKNSNSPHKVHKDKVLAQDMVANSVCFPKYKGYDKFYTEETSSGDIMICLLKSSKHICTVPGNTRFSEILTEYDDIVIKMVDNCLKKRILLERPNGKIKRYYYRFRLDGTLEGTNTDIPIDEVIASQHLAIVESQNETNQVGCEQNLSVVTIQEKHSLNELNDVMVEQRSEDIIDGKLSKQTASETKNIVKEPKKLGISYWYDEDDSEDEEYIGSVNKVAKYRTDTDRLMYKIQDGVVVIKCRRGKMVSYLCRFSILTDLGRLLKQGSVEICGKYMSKKGLRIEALLAGEVNVFTDSGCFLCKMR